MADLVISESAPLQTSKHWEQVSAWLAPLLAKDGRYVPSDILVLHSIGQFRIWLAKDGDTVEAVMVLQLIDYPQLRECFVPWVAGRGMERWRDQFMKASEDFGRANKCKRMVGGFRRGWIRVAGYSEAGAILYKDL